MATSKLVGRHRVCTGRVQETHAEGTDAVPAAVYTVGHLHLGQALRARVAYAQLRVGVTGGSGSPREAYGEPWCDLGRVASKS